MENKTSGGVQPSEKVVYLDNAATTACAPEVLAVMVEALSGACGNPSSHYSVGYEAKEFVDTGRAQVAKAINASPAEIFFTGCGSEADNWAVKGTAFTKARQNKKHLITSAFEHHAIMHSMLLWSAWALKSPISSPPRRAISARRTWRLPSALIPPSSAS